MNPIHLQTFLIVWKHRNYTRAGEELFLSQPAVSRQIRQLEEELGVSLIEQVGKSLYLTDAGRTLAREAPKILGTLERTTEAVRIHRDAEHGRLRVGASTTPGYYLLPPMLGRFHARFPKVELHYVVENSLRIEQMIVRNELDLGFVGGHPSSDDLQTEPVVEDEIVCFAASAHPLARRHRINIRSLEGETWVIRERGSATRRLFESWLEKSGGKIGRAIELHCPEAVKALVTAGVGFSFISAHGVGEEIRQKRLEKLPVSGLNLKRPINLVRHGGKLISPVMDAFMGIVREAVANK
jgi:DNA-binding transcriptional LysR family regulator